MKLEYDRISETNIQAEFYHQCRLKNIPCYLEYKYNRCRFDAVIYNKQTREILLIVEIKSYKHEEDEARVENKQSDKYSRYGIPIMYVVRLDEIDWAISYIENNIIGKVHKPCFIYRKVSDEVKNIFRI